MARAILVDTATTATSSATAVRIVPNASVTVYKADGVTLFDQTMYSAASGGVTLTNPLTASGTGGLVAYANRPDRVVLTSNGVSYPAQFVADQTTVALTTRLPINVMQHPYNAVGDGTTDDTAAIQAALDALVDNGEVYFPPSHEFRITDALTLDGLNHVRVSGGRGSRITQTSSSKNALTVTGCTYLDIQGLALEGRGGTPVASGAAPNAYGIPEHAIEIDAASSHVTITRVYAEGWGGNGVISRADHTCVRDCELVGMNPTVSQTQHSAILLYGNHSEASANLCSLWSVGVHSSQDSGLDAPIHQRITDNVLLSPTGVGTGGTGLGLPGGGNRAQVYASSGKYAYIGSNHIACYQYGNGIKIGFGAFGAVVEANVCNGTVDAVAKTGGGGSIEVNYSEGAVIVGNTVFESVISVAWENLGFDPTGTVVIGNTVRSAPHLDAVSGAITYRGIHGIIAYNTIQNAQNHGIALTDLSGGMDMPSVQIIGNNIRQVGQKTHNTYSAICLGGGGGEAFQNLKIFSNQAYGTGANPQMKYFIDASGASGVGSTIEEFGNTTSGYATARSVYHANVTLQAVAMESPLSVTRTITGGANLEIAGNAAISGTLAVAGLAPLAAKSASTTAITVAPTRAQVNSLSLGLGVGRWVVTACVDIVEVGADDVGRTFDFILTRTGGTSSVLVDGAGTAYFGTQNERATITQQWVVTVTAATTTVKVEIEKSAGTGGSLTSTNSTLTAIPTWAA